MNATIARLTWRTLLGRRRAALLLVLPAVLIALAVALRLIQGRDPGHAATLLSNVGLGLLVPLLGLIAGTGAIGSEIDDGSIVYVLAKPLSRYRVVVTKAGVAFAVIAAFGALPVLAAGVLLAGWQAEVALAYAIGALCAGLAYGALFLLLAVVTRNAVVIGLLYALVWETTVGGYIPGAKALSVRQWGLAVTEKVVGSRASELGTTSAVDLSTATILLAVVTVGSVAYAGYRLRSLRITGEE